MPPRSPERSTDASSPLPLRGGRLDPRAKRSGVRRAVVPEPPPSPPTPPDEPAGSTLRTVTTETMPADPVAAYERLRAQRVRTQASLKRRYDEKQAQAQDQRAFYIPRLEAEAEANKLQKKLDILSSTPLDNYGYPLPTSKKIERWIQDANTRQQGGVPQDLRSYYDAAVTSASDPARSPVEKRRAKVDFVRALERIKHAIDLLPERSEAQRRRKTVLQEHIELWSSPDPNFDWANDQLNAFREANSACEDARQQLWKQRNQETVDRFVRAVARLREEYGTLLALRQVQAEFAQALSEERSDEEADEGDRTIPEGGSPARYPYLEQVNALEQQRSINRLFSRTTTRAANDQGPVVREIKNFRGFQPGSQVPMDRRLRIFNELRVQAARDTAKQATAERLRKQENEGILLQQLVESFEREAQEEQHLLKLGRYAAHEGGTGHEREQPLPSSLHLPPLKTEKQLLEENYAQASKELRELAEQLEQRLGKNALEKPDSLRTSWWNKAKDFWHTRIRKTQDYVKTDDLIRRYHDKQAQAAAMQERLHRVSEPTIAIEQTIILRRNEQLLEEAVAILAHRDTSHEQKLKAMKDAQGAIQSERTLKPFTFEEEQLVHQFARAEKRFTKALEAYRDLLQRRYRGLQEDIAREKALPDNQARRALHTQAQQTLLAREWEAHTLTSLASPERLAYLREAHELEYELVTHPLLHQATRRRQQYEQKINELYRRAYQGYPAFSADRRAA